MGFDVIYVPPIHPIGTSFRKGRNNTLIPAATDPGSPWAIGSPDGGHDAIHPELGDWDAFDRFVAKAREVGLEVALDFALQASPDHPWVTSHPEWFTTRLDGTIAYAENPPKKYQDIYPINFDNDPRRHLPRGAARPEAVDGPRRPHLPRRQPAHQARAVLGVDHAAGARDRPRRAVPRRGVHQAGDDVRARQGRLPPELHLLHLAQHQVGARGVPHRAQHRDGLVLPARTSSSTPPTSTRSSCSRAILRPSRSARCSPRPSPPPGASTPASSCSSTRR